MSVMPDRYTYLDLVALTKLDPAKTTVENFGGEINSSFFDAANILGTLKIMGFIDIRSEFPGPSPVKLTNKGKKVLKDMAERSSEKPDKLDKAIMETIGQGLTTEHDLARDLNVSADSLAQHLYKLNMQGYVDYTIRNGKISLALTELGFNTVGPQPKREKPALKPAVAMATESAPLPAPEKPLEGEVVKPTGWTLLKHSMRYKLYRISPLLLVALIAAVIVIVYLLFR